MTRGGNHPDDVRFERAVRSARRAYSRRRASERWELESFIEAAAALMGWTAPERAPVVKS